MCIFDMPDIPAPPPPPPPPEPVAASKNVDPAITESKDREKKKLAAAKGRESTVLSGGLLDEDAMTKKQTLLGS